MYDADAIEAINFEQLATITDRLLLRGRRVRRLPTRSPAVATTATVAREVAPRTSRDRFSIPSLAPRTGHRKPSARLSPLLDVHAPGSPLAPRTPLAPSTQPLARGSQFDLERTELVCVPRAAAGPATRAHRFAAVVLIPALLGAVLGLAALL